MLLTDWFPRLLTDRQPDDLPFGADGSGQQNFAPGLLMTDSPPQAQQDEPTTLLGYPLSQLQMQPQNFYPSFRVNGLLTDNPGGRTGTQPLPRCSADNKFFGHVQPIYNIGSTIVGILAHANGK